MAARDVVDEKLHPAHEPRWSGRVNLADGQCLLVCAACLAQMMERRDVSSVRKAVALASVSAVLKGNPGVLRQLLMQEYMVGLHVVGALLGMLDTVKDPAILQQIIEVLVQLLLEMQSEQFVQYVLYEIQAQLRDQTSMRGFLPVFNFLGKLLDAVASLSQCLATHHVTLLEHLSMALLFPDEALKSSVCYVFRKVWGCARAAQVIPLPLRDRLCALLLHTLHHACSPQLTINCLGFLKELLKLREVVSVLMNCPAEQDLPLSIDNSSQCNTQLTVERCSLPLILKKLLLCGDETLQVASAQCMASILSHSPNQYCPAFIYADIPEFLCERLCSHSVVLLWSVYSCLLLLAKDALFFSQCHSVYGIDPLVRSLKEVLTLNSVEVLKQGLLLLTEVLERQPVGVSLFPSGPSFAGAVEVLLGGVSSPCLRVATQAATAATALLRLNHQSNPVQYKELQKLVWAVTQRCTELPLPTTVHRHALQTEKSRSQSSRAGVFLLQALVFFQEACRLAEECAGHPEMVENAYTAPDKKNKDDTLESFCLHLLWCCDTACIPTVTRHCERSPCASILKCFFSILSSQFSLLPSMMPQFSTKLASSGFFGMALQYKAFFCAGNRNQILNTACSDFLQRLSACLLSQVDTAEATPQKDCKESEELLQQCLPTLCIYPSQWSSVLYETPGPGDSGMAVAQLRTTQYCMLVLLHLALQHGNRLLPDSSVFSGTVSVLRSVQEQGDEHPPPCVRRAALYLLSVTQDQSPNLDKAVLSCISKVMSFPPGLLSLYIHHAALLQFIFRYPELADSFGSGALELWLTHGNHLSPVPLTRSKIDMPEPSEVNQDLDITVLLCLLERNPVVVLTLLVIMCTGESQLAHRALAVLKVFLRGRPHCNASMSDLLRPRLLHILQRLAVQNSREAGAPSPLSVVLQLLCLIKTSSDANTEMDSIDLKLLFYVSNLTGKLKLCDVESLLPAFNYLYCCLSLSPAHCADRAVSVLLCNAGLMKQLQAVLSCSPCSTAQPAPSLLCCARLLLSSLLTLWRPTSAQVEKSISLSLGETVQLLTFKKRISDSFLLASSLRLLQILLDLDFQSPLLTLTDCTAQCPLDNEERLLHPLDSHRARCLLVALQGLLLQKQEFLLSVSVSCLGSLLAFLYRKSPLTVQHAVHQPWNRLLLYSLLSSGESSFLQPGILALLSLLVRYGGENVLSEADLGQLLDMVEKKGVEELGGSEAQVLKQLLTQLQKKSWQWMTAKLTHRAQTLLDLLSSLPAGHSLHKQILCSGELFFCWSDFALRIHML